jgi:hypothetical protein
MTSDQRSSPRFLTSIRTWFDKPVLNGWVLAILAILFALRKPWALHTPQLWAEDGSIFLAFNDLDGLRAFVEPYMGYLHLIPRLVAWIASHTADPAWWPAIYNGAAFAIALAVIARTFSPRLNLPGKPWLALAFFLGPQTGEVLFNITNIQWFTAILLVEQALVAPPTNLRQRITDLAIVFLVGLTGPFVIAFWPLLAWRWWRDRTGHSLGVLLIATACAITQGVFVLKTGPHFDYPPFNPARFAHIMGQHLAVWPLIGSRWTISLPASVVAIAGAVLTLGLIAFALRPSPLRAVRGVLVAAFLLIVASVIYRGRTDTWNPQDLFFGERYFFIPRLLLFWLLILEFYDAHKLARWIARGLALAIALVHLKGYSLPPMPDYHWAENCDPIRQGVPANIPTLPTGWSMEYRGRPQGRR